MSADVPVRTPSDPTPTPSRGDAVVWSWLLLLTVPLLFFPAFAAAHLPYGLSGYDEGQPAPWWVGLSSGVLFVLIMWAPVAGSMMFARRAVRGGSRAAWAPLVIGLLLTVGALVLLVASLFG